MSGHCPEVLRLASVESMHASTFPLRGRSRSAVTLLELVVAIAVLVVLLGVSVQALRSSSARAADAATLSRLRSHVQVFGAYSSDYNQQFPLIMSPGQAWGFVTFGRHTIRTDYFRSFYAWPYALASGYYDDDPESQAFQPAQDVFSSRQRSESQTGFWYSNSFLADPKFWNARTRTGPDQWRATRQDEVRHTSKKVLFYTAYPYELWDMDSRRAHGFTDGAARFIHGRDMRPADRHSNGRWPGFFASGIPGMQTVDGVHGRDID